jgi:hypothetical protein
MLSLQRSGCLHTQTHRAGESERARGEERAERGCERGREGGRSIRGAGSRSFILIHMSLRFITCRCGPSLCYDETSTVCTCVSPCVPGMLLLAAMLRDALCFSTCSDFGSAAPAMLDDYNVPHIFQHDLFSVLGTLPVYVYTASQPYAALIGTCPT